MENTPIDTSEANRFLNTKEAAKFLGMSNRTLEGYRQQGIGPKFAKLGKNKMSKVGYRLSDLLAWGTRNLHYSTSEYSNNPLENEAKAGQQ